MKGKALTKKKKMPVSESKPFIKTCEKALAMYSTCIADTKRCFIGGCSDEGDNCLIFFRGNVADIFAVKQFLEERDK